MAKNILKCLKSTPLLEVFRYSAKIPYIHSTHLPPTNMASETVKRSIAGSIHQDHERFSDLFTPNISARTVIPTSKVLS